MRPYYDTIGRSNDHRVPRPLGTGLFHVLFAGASEVAILRPYHLFNVPLCYGDSKMQNVPHTLHIQSSFLELVSIKVSVLEDECVSVPEDFFQE